MIESERESRAQNDESVQFVTSTPTQRTNTKCTLGHFIDRTKPDISILCDICKCFINVSELGPHTIHHNALQLFKFQENPTTVEMLLRRRDLLIQRMQRLNLNNESYFKYVKTINEAFQILKRTIEPYFYGDHNCIYDNREASRIQGFSFTPRNRLFLSVGMCANQNKQYKNEMEDTIRFVDCFGGKERFAYIGLFDGYNGKAASSLCREHFHDAILYEMSKFIADMNRSDVENTLINRLYNRIIESKNDDLSAKTIADLYRLAYSKMDYLLSRGIEETSSIRWSGASTLTGVIVANENIEELLDKFEQGLEEQEQNCVLGHIHIANCGNVEALGIRAGEAFLMSQKHTLTNKRERERIVEAGIEISENNLVAGILETTRALGNHGDKDIKKSIINTPYTWSYEIDATLECIIIASEGLWQVLRYDVVVDIVTQCLPAHHLPAPSRIRTALRSVLEKYGRTSVTSDRNDNDDEILACMNEILYILEETKNENDLLTIRHRAVQCSETDIQQDIWNALSAQQRQRLEIAQLIAERLVSAALLASSKANISVVCLLLPGAAI